MKATPKGKIRQKYGFEAPLIPAKTTKNKDYEISLQSLNEKFNIYNLLKGNPRDYYLVRVNGESMINIGINDGDTLIVNANKQPQNDSIVIASLNGEMLVKTLKLIDGKIYLIAQNDKFLPIEIFPEEHFQIKGIVEFVIHNL